MQSFILAQQYFRWHYSRGIADFFRTWGTFLWFTAHFFSFSLIMRTLFAPWKRMEEKGRGIQGFFEALVVNTFVRLTGFIIRLVTLVFGLIIFFLVFTLGCIAFVLWLVFPAAAVIAFIIGVTILIS